LTTTLQLIMVKNPKQFDQLDESEMYYNKRPAWKKKKLFKEPLS